ncbi:MAG TPA: hypothetical protein VGB73_05625 [Pyrinomonadaceae bacterium]|jgi:hypothetical protein
MKRFTLLCASACFCFFSTGATAQIQPYSAARVVPNASAAQWFRTNDGIVIGGHLYLDSLRMKPGGSGAFAFAVDGISL